MARKYARFRMTPEFLRAALLLPDDVSIMSVHRVSMSCSDDVVVEVSGDTIDCPADGAMHNRRPLYEKDGSGTPRLVRWEPWG